jgi:hypothetical protein
MEKINQENKYLVSRLMNQTSVLDNLHDARMKEVREFKKKLSEMRKTITERFTQTHIIKIMQSFYV